MNGITYATARVTAKVGAGLIVPRLIRPTTP